jgi:Uma2 family endonuclease
MTKLTTRRQRPRTVADLIRRLGDIPPDRIRMDPLPGTATEKDVLEVERRENRLCELVRGVLVEKTTGHYESRVAVALIYFLESFLDHADLGIVYGADGTLRLMPQLVRIPDVSFVSWEKLPDRELPAEPIPDLVPDLAIEVLSEGNTPREMQLKLNEYFSVGVRLVWFIDPAKHTASVCTSRSKKRQIGPDGVLDGATVLPGFRLSLEELFTRAGRQRGKKKY